jgi:flagellar basal body-associated protein FliL
MDNKKTILTIVVIVLVVALVAVGYVYWNKWKIAKKGSEALEKAGEATGKLIEGATKGVLPSVGTNPLESKPDINPADKANPFKNIKTNPFE